MEQHLISVQENGDLQFWIIFWCLIARKMSFPYLRSHQKICEDIRSFQLLILWQIKMEEDFKQYMLFTVNSYGFRKFEHIWFVLYNTPTPLQNVVQDSLGVNCCLSWWCGIVSEFRFTPILSLTNNQQIFGTETQAAKCFYFQDIDIMCLLMGMQPSSANIDKVLRVFKGNKKARGRKEPSCWAWRPPRAQS